MTLCVEISSPGEFNARTSTFVLGYSYDGYLSVHERLDGLVDAFGDEFLLHSS